jgi:uncharacterized membrane protein
MLATSVFMIVFRFFHILAGVLWVGSAFLFVGFIGPSAAEVGPAAGPLLVAAVKKRKVVKVITALGGTTTLAGWILWLHDMSAYGGLRDWTTSQFGIGITIGAVLATFSAVEGANQRRRKRRASGRPRSGDRGLGQPTDARDANPDGDDRPASGAPRQTRPHRAGPRRDLHGHGAVMVAT